MPVIVSQVLNKDIEQKFNKGGQQWDFYLGSLWD
jgi:hypothetical protein